MSKTHLTCIQNFFDQIRSRDTHDMAWLGTIDPLHFRMDPDKLNYDSFKFVFASTSLKLRDRVDAYTMEMLTLTSKMSMNGQQCNDIRKTMRKLLNAPAAHMDMEHLLRVIEVYAFLTFRAEKPSGVGVHSRKSRALLGDQPLYFIYVGTEDDPSTLTLERFVQKISEERPPTARQSLLTVLWQEFPPN